MADSTLITGDVVLTMDPQESVFEPGGVLVKGSHVAWVGPADKAPREPDRTIDAGRAIILPGLVNAHTHLAMTVFRGLADDLPLDVWLTEHIFPAEQKLTGQMVYQGARLAAAEMILGGTTCCHDMYLFSREVGPALDQAGIRALIGEVLYDFPSPSYGPIQAGFEYTRALIDEYSAHPRIKVAVQPHAVYTCSPDLLAKVAELADEKDVPVVIHLSETKREVDDCLDKYGKTPVWHLEEVGLLNRRLLVAHAVVLDDIEIALLAKKDVKVAHCPQSNLKLASGMARVADLVAAGVIVGIGTDGPASNNDLDMFEETRTAALLTKGKSLDPTLIPAAKALEMATIDGARALGLGEVTGSLETGKRADLVAIDIDRPHLTPMYDPVSHLVYAAKAADVTLTMVDGRVLMQDRRLLDMDLDEIIAQAREIAEQIKPQG